MAANSASGNFIDSIVKMGFDIIESFDENKRFEQKLKLKTVWSNCGLKASDNSMPILESQTPIENGHKLVLKIPIGLCPSDFTAKKEKLIYAINRAEDIDILTDKQKLIIKVKTIDGKPL